MLFKRKTGKTREEGKGFPDEVTAVVLDKGEKCGTDLMKLSFADEEIRICFSCDRAKCSSLDGKFLTSLGVFVSYVYHLGFDRAFYHDAKRKTLYLFTRLDRTIEISFLPVEDEASEEDLQAMAEAFFEGENVEHIEFSANEIRKEYGKQGRSMAPLLLLVAALFGGFVVYDTYFKKEVVVKRPPRPVVSPLNSQEKLYLKNKTAQMIIADLIREINGYLKDPQRLRLRRVVSYSMGTIDVIPPVQPEYDEALKRWVYNPPFPKRGGVRFSIEKGYQQRYPGVGFQYAGDGLYAKSTTRSYSLDERNVSIGPETRERMVLDEACLKMALKLPQESFAYSRDSKKITFVTRKYDARTLLAKVKKIVDACPAYIEDISLEDNGFSCKVILEKE